MGDFAKLEKKGAIAILSVNRPDALNALNREVLQDLKSRLDELSKDSAIRLLIVTGAGEKAFVAGADIKGMLELDAAGAEEFALLGHQVMNAISHSDLISIAAINGFALGGGLELALACDLRFASTKAKVGLPEVSLGLVPGFGGTQRLARAVGSSRALDLILSADIMGAQDAERIGLVNRLFEPAELLDQTVAYAEKILAHNGPNAQRVARWLVHSGLDLPLQAGLEREIQSFSELFSKDEPKVGMQAFVNKEKPSF